jgi:FAD/FMN-containing dehydrogenase
MSPSRRGLLCAGIGITAAVASRTEGLTISGQGGWCDRPSPDGELGCDPDVRAAAAGDFGGIIRRRPRAVLRPRSSTDIAGLMRLARDRGMKIAARGQGHSTYGRALIDDGIVVDMSAVDTIHVVHPDRIVVDAGATWRSVLDATLARGLTPPVLTNYLGLTVGGTIAVGGIGAMSSRHGMQTDHVLELDVVTGAGEALPCSPTTRPDLFHAARAGLAQCCIITRATLRLVRAPRRIRRFQLSYPDLPSLTADQRRVLAEDRFDQLQGAVIPDGAGGWRYQLEAALHHDGESAPDEGSALAGLADDRGAAVITDVTYSEDAHAFAKVEHLLRSKGQWLTPKPWLLTFLRGTDAERVAGGILDELSRDDIGPFGRITCYPMQTSACRTPLVRLPDEAVAFPFNLIRIPAAADTARIEQMVAQNRAFYDRIRRAGGVQYPVGACPMSPDDWTDHFGPKWPLLREARRRYDPDNLLTPGYNIF